MEYFSCHERPRADYKLIPDEEPDGFDLWWDHDIDPDDETH